MKSARRERLAPTQLHHHWGHDRFQAMTKAHDEPYSDPDTWMVAAPRKDGSWWPEWIAWLEEQSSEPAEPLAIGAAEKGYPPLADAPGLYVLQE